MLKLRASILKIEKLGETRTTLMQWTFMNMLENASKFPNLAHGGVATKVRSGLRSV